MDAIERVAATDPRPHPVAGHPLGSGQPAGAGRVPRSDGDDGVPGARRRGAGARLVRRRARPARPVPRGLGDQVRAGAPRRARPELDLDAPVDDARAGARRLRLPRRAGARRRPDDQRRGLGGGPPRPRRGRPPRSSGLRRGRLVACAAGPGPPASPARHPLRVLHGRLPGARLGARTRHRASATRDALASCGDAGLHRRRRRRRRRDGVALAGGGRSAAAAGGLARGRCRLRLGVPDARVLGRTPFLRPAGSPRHLSTHAGFGYHWWPLDDAGTA